MSFSDLLLQQTINGLSLGAMYSLLALGFTLVYGILELINFAHFNVFMVGSFIGLWTLQFMGINGQAVVMTGLPLIGVMLTALVVTMLSSGVLGVVIERLSLRPLRNVKGPAAMITTIGVSYVLFNIILLTVGADFEELPEPDAADSVRHRRRRAAAAGNPDLGHRRRADAGAASVRPALQDGQGDACHGAGSRRPPA